MALAGSLDLSGLRSRLASRSVRVAKDGPAVGSSILKVVKQPSKVSNNLFYSVYQYAEAPTGELSAVQQVPPICRHQSTKIVSNNFPLSCSPVLELRELLNRTSALESSLAKLEGGESSSKEECLAERRLGRENRLSYVL